MNTVWPFLVKFASLVVCRLRCFDRVLFKGHLALAAPHELERFVDFVLKVRRSDFISCRSLDCLLSTVFAAITVLLVCLGILVNVSRRSRVGRRLGRIPHRLNCIGTGSSRFIVDPDQDLGQDPEE